MCVDSPTAPTTICHVTCWGGSGASAAAATGAAAEAPSTARTLVATPRPAGARLLMRPVEGRRPLHLHRPPATARPGSGRPPGRHAGYGRACIATSLAAAAPHGPPRARPSGTLRHNLCEMVGRASVHSTGFCGGQGTRSLPRDALTSTINTRVNSSVVTVSSPVPDRALRQPASVISTGTLINFIRYCNSRLVYFTRSCLLTFVDVLISQQSHSDPER